MVVIVVVVVHLVVVHLTTFTAILRPGFGLGSSNGFREIAFYPFFASCKFVGYNFVQDLASVPLTAL